MFHKTYFKVTGNKSLITSQTKLLVLIESTVSWGRHTLIHTLQIKCSLREY